MRALRLPSMIVALLAVAPGISAQTPAQSDEAVRQEVLATRQKVRTAVVAKDRPALEKLYDENFNHVRESSRIDLKRERIDRLLKGESAIETATEDELVIQSYGAATAIATGVSPIENRETGKPAMYRWLTVYVKIEGAWRIALSQANRLPKTR